MHGIYHYPAQIAIDESMMWGDYYLLECLNSIAQTKACASEFADD
jgi:hypothetical protein